MPHMTRHDKNSHKKQHKDHTAQPQKARHQGPRVREGKDEPETRQVKGGQGQAKGPTQQQPQPWSRWLPGDDGRWFYQARLKADGSGWEYQFTEGYPSATQRRQGVAQFGAYYPSHEQQLQAVPVFGVAPTQSHASPTVPATLPAISPDQKSEPMGGEEQGLGRLHEESLSPLSEILQPSHGAAQEHQEPLLASTSSPVPGATATQQPALKANVRGDLRQKKASVGGKKKKKKLSVVVKAEKDLKFNPKKIVKGWLDEVDTS